MPVTILSDSHRRSLFLTTNLRSAILPKPSHSLNNFISGLQLFPQKHFWGVIKKEQVMYHGSFQLGNTTEAFVNIQNYMLTYRITMLDAVSGL